MGAGVGVVAPLENGDGLIPGVARTAVGSNDRPPLRGVAGSGDRYIEVNRVVQRGLIDKRQNVCEEAPTGTGLLNPVIRHARPGAGWNRNTSRGKRVVRRLVVVQRETDLLEMILALRAACSFARLLHGRQEQGDQDGNNSNHHQKFDEREATGAARSEPRERHEGISGKSILATRNGRVR